MSIAVIRTLSKRRDDVHRRIGELRAELKLQEARAEEIEVILRALVNEEQAAQGLPITPPPNAANGTKTKASVSDLILAAINEMGGVGYEAADREGIFKIVRRTMPEVKQNTLRVALIRMTKNGQIERMGNIYCLAGHGVEKS